MKQSGGSYRSLVAAFCLLLPLIAFGVWTAARNAGGIAHDEITIVHSGKWDAGKSKTCTTINGNGAGAPEQPSRIPQNIVCDGVVPSGDPADVKDGKMLKVHFQGETFLFGQDLKMVLVWSCTKDSPDESASITCERESERSPAP